MRRMYSTCIPRDATHRRATTLVPWFRSMPHINNGHSMSVSTNCHQTTNLSGIGPKYAVRSVPLSIGSSSFTRGPCAQPTWRWRAQDEASGQRHGHHARQNCRSLTNASQQAGLRLLRKSFFVPRRAARALSWPLRHSWWADKRHGQPVPSLCCAASRGLRPLGSPRHPYRS